jgi:hypothetical protein
MALPLNVSNLSRRFGKAREAAVLATEDTELAAWIKEFQFRDIRPKAASDIPSVQDARNLSGIPVRK